jgi:glycine cleavage system aminomethyltransferase T
MLITRDGNGPQGHVSAAGIRVTQGGSIALALLEGGFARMDEELIASSPTRGMQARVRVVTPHFYDASGERYRD